MTLKNFRYLNTSHKDAKRFSVKGSDKPCELHSVFNAMVASTRPEKKKMGYQGKTPEQHLADAKAITLFGIKVLDEIPRKVGAYWQVLIECERCGTQKWVNKNDLTRTKSCGCLKPGSAKPKVEKKVEPFELAEPVDIVEKEQPKITLPKEDFKAFEEAFEKVNAPAEEIVTEKANRVTVSRRLVMGLADECQKLWCDQNFWELSPALFKTLIQDTQEIYEALRGR